MSSGKHQARTAKTNGEIFVSVAIENAVDRAHDVSSFMVAVAKVMELAADEDGQYPGVITPVILSGLAQGVRIVATKICEDADDLDRAVNAGGDE